MTEFHFGLKQRVEQLLTKSGLDYQAEPRIGGIQPDFVVNSPDGKRHVLEVKGWDSDPLHRARATKQARLFRVATGADSAYIVLPDSLPDNSEEGLLSLDNFEKQLLTWSESTSRLAKTHFSIKTEHDENKPPDDSTASASQQGDIVFAAMPYAEKYEDVFFIAMASAAREANVTCKRVDQEDYEGDVVAEIEKLIQKSAAVIADLSEAHPNVLYEVGYARGLNKPTIPICSSPVENLPFDVSKWNIIAYGIGQTHALTTILTRRLKAVIAKI